jgi:hypothetical protein
MLGRGNEMKGFDRASSRPSEIFDRFKILMDLANSLGFGHFCAPKTQKYGTTEAGVKGSDLA